MAEDILIQDATSQLAALQSKRISAEELLKLALGRQERLHKRLNAVIKADLTHALERARSIDDTRVKDGPLGPLAGLPMTIKDTLDVHGMPASAGLDSFRHRVCEDANAVNGARRAGAVIWGKTNVPVLAGDWQSYNDLYGTTSNPWDLERTSGGSSGGAAAALAVGITPLEIGSDIGGSLRVPASFCGVFSHKPTWGLVSQIGHVPPQPGAHAERDLNVIGPMARSARDLRLLLSLIADGPVAARAPAADLTKTRIGVWIEEDGFPLDGEIRTVLEAFVTQLAQSGAEIEIISSPVPTDQLMAAYQVLLGSIIGADMPEAQRKQMAAMRGVSKLAVSLGADERSALAQVRAYTATHAEWLEANEERCRLRDSLKTVFSKYDVILAPVSPTVAFPHNHKPFNGRKLTMTDGKTIPYGAMLNWIALATACHLPVTTVPAGQTASGLPVGIQIIGPQGGDARTLAVAQAIDENIGGFVAPAMDF
ncbi:amidase family protein [Phenylobacterium sp.]|uniref:amidase family protein n=1 Tax=Phenylobacterium sp. TaxID=1871053 RepID=UPI0027165790|nr:amidase family protein [Phenylobacterium sp.]MDO8798876.1 amidase family protein [Phenylobacterium sp.]